jgi:hypothetical protein
MAGLSVVEARVPTLAGLSSLGGSVTMTGARRDIVVESCELMVVYRDRELGSARLTTPVEIPARDTSEVRYDFALEGLSMASMQTLGMRAMISPDSFTVDVSGRVRLGRATKKIELQGVPLSRVMEIITTFAP